MKTFDLKVQLNIQIWKEGEMYVSYIPQLDISSCGKTVDEAKDNIIEAIEAFLEEAKKMGTVDQVLEEAGFTFEEGWNAPDIVAFEKVQLS